MNAIFCNTSYTEKLSAESLSTKSTKDSFSSNFQFSTVSTTKGSKTSTGASTSLRMAISSVSVEEEIISDKDMSDDALYDVKGSTLSDDESLSTKGCFFSKFQFSTVSTTKGSKKGSGASKSLRMAVSTVSDDEEIISDKDMSDEELSDDELTDEELSDDKLSDDELSDEALSDDELSDEALSDDELSDEELSDDELSDGEVSDEELSDDELSDDELSDDELSDEELSDEELSDHEVGSQ